MTSPFADLCDALDEAVAVNRKTQHERALSRAAALIGRHVEVAQRERGARRGELRLDAALERASEAIQNLAEIVITDDTSTEGPGLVGEGRPGYGTDTAAVTPGRPTEGDPGGSPRVVAEVAVNEPASRLAEVWHDGKLIARALVHVLEATECRRD